MLSFFNRRIGCELIVCVMVSAALPAVAQSVPPNPSSAATLRSTPQTVVWGYVIPLSWRVFRFPQLTRQQPKRLLHNVIIASARFPLFLLLSAHISCLGLLGAYSRIARKCGRN
jgi:hypothetical protein